MRPSDQKDPAKRPRVEPGTDPTEPDDRTARSGTEQALLAVTHELEATQAELSAVKAQLVLQEKMATLGQLTAGIAHEIKNPLNFITNFAMLTVELVAELDEQMGTNKIPAIVEILATISRNLRKIAEHGQRTDSIVRTMLLHSRSGGVEWAETDIVRLVDDACNLGLHGARANYPSAVFNLARDLPDHPIPATIVPQDIARVILNLLSNGFYATVKRAREGDDIDYVSRVSVALAETMAGIEIVIRDNGVGMDETVRAKALTPFFTTKAPGEGTGLGLSLSYDVIVNRHHGELRIASEPMGYTEVTIELPRSAGIGLRS
jgi:signal transduction histidine kinase